MNKLCEREVSTYVDWIECDQKLLYVRMRGTAFCNSSVHLDLNRSDTVEKYIIKRRADRVLFL